METINFVNILEKISYKWKKNSKKEFNQRT